MGESMGRQNGFHRSSMSEYVLIIVAFYLLIHERQTNDSSVYV